MHRKVFVAEGRAGRPTDYASPAAEAAPPGEAECPFCAGQESKTPPTLTELADGEGGWRVRVIPNKFPAVSWEGGGQFRDDLARDPRAASLFAAGPAAGAHEVIIESPRHVSELTEVSPQQLTDVLLVYRDRLRHWAVDGRLAHALVFKNSGYVAGASLSHVHSQLIALPSVPPTVQAELDGARQYFQQHHRCVYCQLVDEERAGGERLFADAGEFVSFCAYAGRQPFESWIVPSEHASRFEDISDAAAGKLAEVLQEAISRLQRVISPLAYNLVLHTAPFTAENRDSYHWHWELTPRSNRLAGLELGAGVFINPLSPEHAAATLRNTQV